MFGDAVDHMNISQVILMIPQKYLMVLGFARPPHVDIAILFLTDNARNDIISYHAQLSHLVT